MDTVDLAATCGPLPRGGELASDAYQGNLILRIEGVLSLTEGMRWGIRIEKPTITPSGHKGKPQPVLTLVGVQGGGQTIPDLLRSLAAMWDQGDVEIGKAYSA